MAKATKSEKVPPAMQEKFDQITALTDHFAQQHLNNEYAQLIRLATAALCRKRPSPLNSGKPATWACGITHAIGMANFLFDPAQTPHISAGNIYKIFGVSGGTGQAKSKLVRDALQISQWDPDWCLPSKIGNNPLVWMIEVNGFIMDVRMAPRQIQAAAFAKGIIPYIPADQAAPASDAPPTPIERTRRTPTNPRTPTTSAPQRRPGSADALYTLDVFIVNGPITAKFVKKNPVISRTIAIQGNQTLADLHRIIFKAFDREEEHMYEFQIGGAGPNDPQAQRYGLPMAFGSGQDDEPTGDVNHTTIAALGLSVDEALGYWFDFGDDWWHQINVMAIAPTAPKGKYPQITARVGASPPQYADA
jgi:Domain of unknown function (DUF6398)/Plasmid pRiA4b ORF-3-like protein